MSMVIISSFFIIFIIKKIFTSTICQSSEVDNKELKETNCSLELAVYSKTQDPNT